MALPIKVGPTDSALRILLYGQEGVGKTTWASDAPQPLFLTCEDGGGDLDIARLQCNSWGDLRDYVKQILRDGTDGYKTLVIDTINGFERLLFEHICRVSKVDSIEEVAGGFGKGYTRAGEEMASLQQDLDKLRMKHKTPIILLGHAHVKPFNDPNGPSYDKYELRMNAKTASIWTAWVDAQLFACYAVTVKGGRRNGTVTDPTQKGKATDVSRVVYATKDAAYDAKNRHSLPEELPLKWSSFASAIGWDRRMQEPVPETPPTDEQVVEAIDICKASARTYSFDEARALLYRLQGIAKAKAAPTDWPAILARFKGNAAAILTHLDPVGGK